MRSIYKYLIALGAGAAVACLIAYSKGILGASEISAVYHILHDSFIVPAVVIAGSGGLIFVSNEGAFDGISYGLKSFFDIFRKEKRNKHTSFYDYKESKSGKEMSCGYLVLAGLTLLAVAVVMLLLYNQTV